MTRSDLVDTFLIILSGMHAQEIEKIAHLDQIVKERVALGGNVKEVEKALFDVTYQAIMNIPGFFLSNIVDMND